MSHSIEACTQGLHGLCGLWHFMAFYGILKSRRIPKSLEQILLSIDTFAKPGYNIKDYSVYDDADLWGDVYKDLEVPNTFANRVKIRKATAHLWKVFSLF